MIDQNLTVNRRELLARIAAVMTPRRFQHVLGVEQTALELAAQYGCDPKQASLAALLHDYAKEMSDQTFKDLIVRYDLDRDLLNWNNQIWHGIVGAYQIAEDFGLEDSTILQAIQRHTVGAADMGLLDKILYVADYIEPNRDFPGVETVRRLARISLDQAVAYEATQTLAYLKRKGQSIYPQTLETERYYRRFLSE